MATHPDEQWTPYDVMDDRESQGAFDDVIDPPDPDRDTRMGSDAARALSQLADTMNREVTSLSGFALNLGYDASKALHRSQLELETARELWAEAQEESKK